MRIIRREPFRGEVALQHGVDSLVRDLNANQGEDALTTASFVRAQAFPRPFSDGY
jgi:hypothetical protein